MMVRNVLGSILALAAVVGAVLSPFHPWWDGRHGTDYRIADLFNGISGSGTGAAGSVLLPLAFAALVTLLGVRLRSRLLVASAGAVVLGFTVLWMVRQGQAAGGLGISGDGSGLGTGVAYALGSGLLLFLAALVMRGRRPAPRPEAAPVAPAGFGPPPGRYWTPQDDAYQQNWPPQQGPVAPEYQYPAEPGQDVWTPQDHRPAQDGDTQSMSTVRGWGPDRPWGPEQPWGPDRSAR
jgi:hypothetical protein